jgi:hypothetical protein
MRRWLTVGAVVVLVTCSALGASSAEASEYGRCLTVGPRAQGPHTHIPCTRTNAGGTRNGEWFPWGTGRRIKPGDVFGRGSAGDSVALNSPVGNIVCSPATSFRRHQAHPMEEWDPHDFGGPDPDTTQTKILSATSGITHFHFQRCAGDTASPFAGICSTGDAGPAAINFNAQVVLGANLGPNIRYVVAPQVDLECDKTTSLRFAGTITGAPAPKPQWRDQAIPFVAEELLGEYSTDGGSTWLTIPMELEAHLTQHFHVPNISIRVS